MTTTPVMAITDEQIAEIEALSERNHDYVPVSPAHMQDIISRLRAAEKDESRFQWLMRELGSSIADLVTGDTLASDEGVIEAIDAAMEQSK